jgi:multiple sugar transport system substrate-binding protein/sn-glycerol 3-phosphate transport system substrate-binding protein
MLEEDASRLASMVFSRGSDLMDAAQEAYTLNTPAVRAALTLMRELAAEGCVELLGEQNADTQEFAVGQVLFLLDSSSGLPFVKIGVNSGLGFAWGVTATPYEGERPIVNVYGASVAVCRTTPAQQLAAWMFLKWFTEPAQQARWVRASHYFPVRRSTARELEGFFAENPSYRTAYELLDYGKSEPSVSGYEPVRRLIAEAMVEALQGGDLDRVLVRLEQEANATLQKHRR